MDFCKKFRLWDTFVFERSDRALEMCMASGTSPKEFLTVSHSSRRSRGDESVPKECVFAAYTGAWKWFNFEDQCR